MRGLQKSKLWSMQTILKASVDCYALSNQVSKFVANIDLEAEITDKIKKEVQTNLLNEALYLLT